VLQESFRPGQQLLKPASRQLEVISKPEPDPTAEPLPMGCAFVEQENMSKIPTTILSIFAA